MTAVVRSTNLDNQAPSLTRTLTFSSLPTSGNCVAVFIGEDSASGASSVASVTDNQGNTYTARAQAGNASNANAQIWTCDVIGAPSGTFIVTVTLNTNSFGSAIASEISGLTATIQDHTGTNNGASGSRSTFSVTASGANTNAICIVLACIYWNASSANVGLSTPASSGYTSLAVQQDGNTYGGFEASYKVVSATETSSATWTFNSATGGVATALVTLHGAAAGGGTAIAVLSGYYARAGIR